MASFTALNGGDAKSPEGPGGSPTRKRAASEDRPASRQAVPEAKGGEVPTTQRENWSGRSTEGPSYQLTTYPEAEGSHKRKRTNSVEPSREVQSTREQQLEARDAYMTPQRERDGYRPFGEEKRESHEAWYAQQGQEEQAAYDQQQNLADPLPSQSEERTGDALRRATSHADSQHDYPATSPDGDDNSGMYGGSFNADGRRDAVIQSDPKKRKRNFSNRTKTGCLTCRKRKKKCDETKPECINCVRGGFICQGYPNQRGYQKLENKPSTVPLESKDPSYVPPGAYGMPQPQSNNYPNPPPPVPKRDSVPSYRGQPLRIDPPQGRPVLTDDDRQTATTIPTASTGSPDNKLSAFSAYPSNMFPTPISAVSSVQTNSLPTPLSSVDRPKEYPRVPPLHDLTRTEPETPHAASLPQISMLRQTQTSSPAAQPPPPPPPTTNPQVAAQLALSHPFPTSRQRTQKEAMLQGREYFPFDRELMLERQRCSAACWRFNNSTNPNTGVSGAERSRLFREILNPTEPVNISPQVASPVTNVGRVGSEVVVEAPFTCDYGYNITIGDHVFIGRNCTIIDPMEIKIGNNCYVGPNVSLFGANLHTDPKRRAGSKSAHIGSPIIIDEDVWIGGGVIIMPGLKIGRGATVGAGSVVTRDVPPFTVVAGNPAHVMRGASSYAPREERP
ncbi:hypothetical protein DL764_004720 [Monosporascus ibericus]|uniref:Zn(2)-C6 fungal-type domain-containing protein n=1 Tax=Monosporascus ibericus TaxID=155417 RepID=A0A4Q4TBK7_9PEZI|nr:hypothetical protein DL764_004720 [Monosporascus ibericus]